MYTIQFFFCFCGKHYLLEEYGWDTYGVCVFLVFGDVYAEEEWACRVMMRLLTGNKSRNKHVFWSVVKVQARDEQRRRKTSDNPEEGQTQPVNWLVNGGNCTVGFYFGFFH